MDGTLNAGADADHALHVPPKRTRTSGESGTLFDYNGNTSHVRDNYVVASHKWVLGSNRLNEAYLQAGHTLVGLPREVSRR